MGISTKKGDSGLTSLWSGQRIPKNHLRVEAYGTIDELSASIAEARHYCHEQQVIEDLIKVIDHLFFIAGELATDGKSFSSPIHHDHVDWVAQRVGHYERLVPLKGFVIPGSILSSAKIDLSRTICRRAERRIITLHQQFPVSSLVLQYINRLSDLLFMIARAEEAGEGKITYQKTKGGI